MPSDWEVVDDSNDWEIVKDQPQQPIERQNIVGQVFNVPGAAIRSSLMGRGYIAGALRPSEVPTFQQQALQSAGEPYSETASKRTGILDPNKPLGRTAIMAESAVGGMIPSAVGMAADVATNPADALIALLGMTPQAKIAGKAIAEIKPVQAFSKFMTKERNIGIFKNIKGAFKFIPNTDEKEIGLTGRVRGEIAATKQNAVNEFGGALDELAKNNPDKVVSLRETVDSINLDPELSTEARNVFNKTPILRDLLKNPELADNVSLRQTQDIINYIQTKVPQQVKANHIDILDHLGDIRASQLEAFPEMSDVREAYGQVKNSYKVIKPGLKAGSLLENLAKNWKDSEIRDAFYDLVKNPETLASIKNYQNAIKILHTSGLIAKSAMVGAAGMEVYNVLKSALQKK